MVGRAIANLEAVASAVRVEIEFAELYAALANRARNPDARKLLRAMASDEELHRSELMDLYEEMLEGQGPSIPPTQRERGTALDATDDCQTVFEVAYAKELDAERFYREAAQWAIDSKTRLLFLTLAETENAHAASLRKVLSRLKQDPGWLERWDDASTHGGP